MFDAIKELNRQIFWKLFREVREINSFRQDNKLQMKDVVEVEFKLGVWDENIGMEIVEKTFFMYSLFALIHEISCHVGQRFGWCDDLSCGCEYPKLADDTVVTLWLEPRTKMFDGEMYHGTQLCVIS